MVSGIFRSLQFFNYKLFFFGGLISNTGTWMQSTAMSWVLLMELSDNDATLLGIAFALQYLPPITLIPLTGWVADKFPRRFGLMTLQTVMLVHSAAVGILLLSGVLTASLMLIMAAAQGLIQAFEVPVRQTLLTDLVPRSHESNAVALNSASFNIARLLGPAAGGFLIVWVGSGWVFIINAASCLAALAALIFMDAEKIHVSAKRTERMSALGGLRYMVRRRDLLVLTLCIFAVAAFTANISLVTVTMSVAFGQDADGFGLVNTVLAVGSMAGALTAAQRHRANYRSIALAMSGVAVLTGISSMAPTYVLYLLVMAPLGYVIVFVLATSNAYVQSTTERGLRGRVLAAYMAMLFGGVALGSLYLGIMADSFGARWAVASGAVIAAIAAVALFAVREPNLPERQIPPKEPLAG